MKIKMKVMSQRKLLMLIFIAFLWTVLFLNPTVSFAADRFWVGGTGDWSNTARWSTTSGGAGGASAPGSADTARFDANSGGGTATVDASFAGTISAINMETGNTTQVSLARSLAVTTFTLTAGTFDAGSQTLTVSGALTISGGSFTEGTSTVETTGGTFTWDVVTSETFYNLTINKTSGYPLTVASGDTLVVTNTLTLTDGVIQTGTVEAQGGVTHGSGFDGGASASSGTLTITGAGTRTINLTASGQLPIFTLNAANVTVNGPASGTVTFVGALTIQAGTFNAGAGTLSFGSSAGFTISGGSFNEETSTVGTTGTSATWDVVTSETFYNLTINKTNGHALTVASGDTLVVTNTLTLTDGIIQTGTVEAQGGVTQASTFDGSEGGTASITITGTASQTFTGNATASAGSLPYVTINKTGGTLTLSGTIRTFRDWTYTQGTVDATTNNSTVVFAGSPTVDGQGTSATMAFDNVEINGTTITLGGNLDVNGDLTITSGTLTTSASNYSVNVAGSWANSGTFTSNSSVVTFDTSSTATINTGGTGTTQDFQTFTVDKSGGSLQLTTNGLDVDGTLTITAGTLDLNGLNLSTVTTCNITGTLKLTGDETVNCTPTLNSGSTVEYSATTGTRDIKNWTYDNLKINGSGGTFTSGANETLGAGLWVAAGTFDISTGSRSFVMASTTISGGTLTATNATMDVNGEVTISSGILTAPSGTFTVSGNWTKNGGTFTHSSGTVTLDGASAQTLSGTMTGASAFYNLTVTNGSGTAPSDCEITGWAPGIDFAASASTTNNYTITTASAKVEYNSGSLYTFENINWNGQAVGTPLYFRNSAASGSWLLYVPGTQTAVSYVNVSRSDASGSNAISADNGTNTNCDNNTSWNFVSSYLYFAVDSATQSLPTLTPGTLVATTSILTTRTNNSTGFYITVSRDDSTGTMKSGTVYIPDKTGWSAPAATTTAGNATASTTESLTLQFRIRLAGTDTPNYASSWWGSDDTTANALFAGFPATSQKVIIRSTPATATTTSYALYNVNVPSTQQSGDYSGAITYTATANP